MINFLKSIPDVSLYFLLWGLLAYWLKRRNHKLFKPVIFTGLLLLLISSTNYLPQKLIHSIEKNYAPIELSQLEKSESYFIHVLGAGATPDSKLPASMNLDSATLTRLFEGIRIYAYLEQRILVTSASLRNFEISQAQLSKEAAISVGVPEENIRTLETPGTTVEEALAFKEKFGTDTKIILVTSALHMPRAVEIFTDQGLNVIPAPSNYIYKEDGKSNNGLSFPSLRSIELMNTYHLEVLKHGYYKLIKNRILK